MTAYGQVRADAMLDEAVRLHQSGALADAERLYRELIRHHPEEWRAHYYMGVARQQQGDVDGAIAAYERVLALDPQNVAAATQLAGALGMAGRLDEAERRLDAILVRAPDHAAGWAALGSVREASGRLDEAIDAFNAALRFKPGQAAVHNNLGIVLARQGRLDEAEAQYRHALAIDGELADAASNLGTLLSRRGRHGDALEHLRHAHELQPQAAGVAVNLAETLVDIGEIDLAQQIYTRLLADDPANRAARSGLVTVLERARPRRYQPALDRLLTAAFGWDNVRLDRLAVMAARHLLMKHGFAADAERPPALDDTAVDKLAGDRLLNAFLPRVINRLPALETVLVALRRHLALEGTLSPDAAPRRFALAVALARQAALGEHVWAQREEERAAVPAWRRRIEAVDDWSVAGSELIAEFVRYALYESPAALRNAQGIAEAPQSAWPEGLIPLVGREVGELIEARRRADAMPKLTPIGGAAMQAVAAAYDRHPYPRWTTVSLREPETAAAVLRNLFPHFEPPLFLNRPIDALVPGCGAGQHPIADVRTVYACRRVVAVDISRISLGLAALKAEELGVDGIEFAQADIMELDAIDDRFHLIEAGGVFHHLPEPERALAILADRLVPEGVMMVALFSERARERVTAARQAVRARGLDDSDDAIRALRAEVLSSDAPETLRPLRALPDFHSMTGCRHLLFHGHERRFTLPEVAGLLERTGLELLGLQISNPDTLRAYRQTYPEDPSMTDLALWDEFESHHPMAFEEMYHVWCRKPA